MRARFLGPEKILNPEWSQAAQDAARDSEKPYDVPMWIDVEAGYEFDDHQAWIHCCPGDLNAPPRAEPVDDECRAAVREWMEVQRPARINVIKAQLEQIDLVKNPQDRERLLAMGRAYGLIGSEAKKQKAAAKQDATPASEN